MEQEEQYILIIIQPTQTLQTAHLPVTRQEVILYGYKTNFEYL
jgi:hypothetical protein